MSLNLGKGILGLVLVFLLSVFGYNTYRVYQDGLKYKECVKMLQNERNKVNELVKVRDDYAQTIYELNYTLNNLNTQLDILEVINEGDKNETNKDIFDDIIRVKF